VPKHPATKARLGEVEEAESRIDVRELIRAGIENATDERFSFPN
jgi:hypothetical protein